MISILVATRNRPQLLVELLQSIQNQELKPFEVIIVDASDDFLPLDYQNYSFEIQHIKSDDPSISRQRNIGLNLVSKASIYLAVLDDDTIPTSSYLREVILFLENSVDAVGASGITDDAFSKNVNKKWMAFIKTLFFLESERSGVITKGAVNIGLRSVSRFPIETQWLIGCSVFKINKIRNLFYEKSLDGYSLGEDVIFSYKASAYGKLYLLPDVKLSHRQLSEHAHYKSQYWYKWVSYRKLLVSIMPGKHIKWIYYGWANFGQMIVVFLGRKETTKHDRMLSILAFIRGTLRG
jgi:glycosyltransferase involved in cell wall biosynthesis